MAPYKNTAIREIAPDREGVLEGWYLPGREFAKGEINVFASFNSKQAWAYPMLSVFIFWAGLSAFIFYTVMAVISWTETWPTNLWINIMSFQLAWWIGGAIVTGAVFIGSLFYLGNYSYMTHYHRSVIVLFMLVVVFTFAITCVRLAVFKHNYPNPNKGLLPVYTDWLSILVNIVMGFFPLLFGFVLFVNALYYPTKATFSLDNKDVNRFYEFISGGR